MENENKVSKELCEERNSSIKDSLTGLKANIRTSKESLSNRLDKVNDALIGDASDPGGLLREVRDMHEEINRHNAAVDKEIDMHQKLTAKDIKLIYKLTWVTWGFIALLLGGSFFGISLDKVRSFVKPTPIVKVIPKTEETEKLPVEIREYIKEILKENDSPEGGK
jgi:hypothetical protein